jgi:hypothetical protein
MKDMDVTMHDVVEGGNIVHLFSYGSNSPKQLYERIGHVSAAKPAYLENHIRIFAGYSKRWNGGIASIWPVEDEKLYGYVTSLTHEQLLQLDTLRVDIHAK